MNKILEGIAKVNELTVRVGDYCIANPSQQNESLKWFVNILIAYNLALDQIVRVADLDEIQIRKLIEIFDTVDPNEADMLRQVLPHMRHIFLPESRQELRQEFIQRFKVALNMYFDGAKQLLMSREMKDQGMTDAEIDRQIKSAKTENLF